MDAMYTRCIAQFERGKSEGGHCVTRARDKRAEANNRAGRPDALSNSWWRSRSSHRISSLVSRVPRKGKIGPVIKSLVDLGQSFLNRVSARWQFLFFSFFFLLYVLFKRSIQFFFNEMIELIIFTFFELRKVKVYKICVKKKKKERKNVKRYGYSWK